MDFINAPKIIGDPGWHSWLPATPASTSARIYVSVRIARHGGVL